MSDQGKSVVKAQYSIARSLVFWFLLLALVPLAVSSWIGYREAVVGLTSSAAESLEQGARLKARFIQNWFDYRFIDLNNQANNYRNAEFLLTLKEGFQNSGKNLEEFVKSYSWVLLVDERQRDLVAFMRHYDYLYDLYLIDTEGNVLFTVEHQNDFGSNLFTGPQASSLFSHSIRASLRTGQALFSDLEHYAPSNNRLTGFLTAPMQNEWGNTIGVFAMQLRLERINEFMMESSIEGSTRHYLVGEDGLLRTAIKGGASVKVLSDQIDTEQFKLWQSGHGKGMHQADDVRESASSYMGPFGIEVIGLHQGIKMSGVNWALISEVNKSEALSGASALGQITLVIFLLTAGLVAVLAIYQARRITRPLVQLADASMAVASGEMGQRVYVKADNEIGTLAGAFNHMMEMRTQYVKELKLQTEQAKNALADLAEQQFALDQHSIVAITDAGGTITFANEKFSEVSGYSCSELIGQNHRILNSGFHDDGFFRDMYQTIAAGKVWHGEIFNRGKGGKYYWVDTTIVPYMSSGGKPKSYIAIRTDITERKQVEIAMLEAREAAEAANHAKSDFLANMSHEIRTPMNGVIGMTNLLLDSGLDNEQHKRALTIKHSADSLLSLLNDILDFSKIEVGKLELEILDFDLDVLMEDLAATMIFRAEEKDVELVCPANPTFHHWYKGDPDRIRQVMINLAGNAFKFTEKGEVSLRYEVVGNYDGRTLLRFEVSDTGVGLSQEQQGKLFDHFIQADNSTTRKYGGTGLGLAICKRLVELMDGEIGINSMPGEGSTFWFTLDLKQVEAQEPPFHVIDMSQQKMLVVDDNATNRQLLDEVLDAWSIEHGLAESGSDALQALKDAAAENKPYSVAIIDMKMPEMDGVQLGKLIREDNKISRTRMVLLTSQGRPGDASKIQKSGFDSYLSKPVNQSELYNALLQVVGMAGDEGRLKTRYAIREAQKFDARVLVVEDNITNQKVARGMLEKFGIHVDVAANGEEAITLLTELPYDLVFMDCHMPVKDGYEAAREIRDPQSSVENHDIPVVAMTANAMQGDREHCLAAGMNDHLAKPVDPARLRRSLLQWLPVHCYAENTKAAEPEPEPEPEQGAGQVSQTEKSKDISQKEPKTESSMIDDDLANETTVNESLSGESVHDEKTDEDASSSSQVFAHESMRHRLMDDDALIRSVAEAFLADMLVQIEQLNTVVADDNLQQATAQAHKIKGASANVGGVALSELAMKMEVAGKAGELVTIRENLTDLDQRFAQLKTSMEQKIF